MPDIPLYYLLFAYAFFLLVFVIFSIINLSHLSHSGALTFTSFVVTIIMAVIVTVIFLATWYFLKDVSWATPVLPNNFLGNGI